MCNFRYGLNPTYYFLTNTASSLSTAFACNIQVLQFSQLRHLIGTQVTSGGKKPWHKAQLSLGSNQKWKIFQCFVYWGFRPCRARPTSNATLTMTRLHFATLFTTEPITKLKRKSQQTFESVWKNHMKDLKLIHLTLKTWDAKTPPSRRDRTPDSFKRNSLHAITAPTVPGLKSPSAVTVPVTSQDFNVRVWYQTSPNDLRPQPPEAVSERP